jgi:hypothetical protein
MDECAWVQMEECKMKIDCPINHQNLIPTVAQCHSDARGKVFKKSVD